MSKRSELLKRAKLLKRARELQAPVDISQPDIPPELSGFEELLQTTKATTLGGVQEALFSLPRLIPGFAKAADVAQKESPFAFGTGQVGGTIASLFVPGGPLARLGKAGLAVTKAAKVPKAVVQTIAGAGLGATEVGVREAVDIVRGEQRPGTAQRLAAGTLFGAGGGVVGDILAKPAVRETLFEVISPLTKTLRQASKDFRLAVKKGDIPAGSIDPSITPRLLEENLVGNVTGIRREAKKINAELAEQVDLILGKTDEALGETIPSAAIIGEGNLPRSPFDFEELIAAGELDEAQKAFKKINQIFPPEQKFTLRALQLKKQRIDKRLKKKNFTSDTNPATTEAQVLSANAIRDFLEMAAPEVGPLNKRAQALLILRKNTSGDATKSVFDVMNEVTFSGAGFVARRGVQAAGAGPLLAAGTVAAVGGAGKLASASAPIVSRLAQQPNIAGFAAGLGSAEPVQDINTSVLDILGLIDKK